MTVTYPIDLSSLDQAGQNSAIVTFITMDPFNVGLSAIRTAHPGSDPELVAALSNVNGAGAAAVTGDPITSSALLDLLDATEYAKLTQSQLSQLQTIFAVQTVNVGGSPMQDKLNLILATYATSLARVQATYTRPGSPWERAFGKGQVPTINQLDAARASGPNAF